MRYDIKESGRRIRNLRKQHGMTQGQLAEQINLGLTNVGRIERGQQGLSIDSLIEVALFFGVSLDYIVLGHDTQVDMIKTALRHADLLHRLHHEKSGLDYGRHICRRACYNRTKSCKAL